MKILLLSRYARLGSSSRVRFYQYLPHLENHGFSFTVAPLLDDRYVENLYAGKPQQPVSIALAYFRRVGMLLSSRRYDLIWLEKELFPFLPAWAETLLARSGVPYIVDYDDAVFHRYDLHRMGFVRSLLGKKIERVMRNAALVVAGNDYLADYAQQAGAKRVAQLPSVVDMDRYPAPSPKPSSVFTIGWIGAPITAPYLEAVRGALKAVTENGRKTRVVLIGSGPGTLAGLPTEIWPWTEGGEVSDLQQFDVGIMPLPDEPFERGKCGYKLIQYMAAGVPGVASPVGVNTKIVEHGVDGFIAETDDEWRDALINLRDHSDTRRAVGAAGRKKVIEQYSLQANTPKLAVLLESVKR